MLFYPKHRLKDNILEMSVSEDIDNLAKGNDEKICMKTNFPKPAVGSCPKFKSKI